MGVGVGLAVGVGVEAGAAVRGGVGRGEAVGIGVERAAVGVVAGTWLAAAGSLGADPSQAASASTLTAPTLARRKERLDRFSLDGLRRVTRRSCAGPFV